MIPDDDTRTGTQRGRNEACPKADAITNNRYQWPSLLDSVWATTFGRPKLPLPGLNSRSVACNCRRDQRLLCQDICRVRRPQAIFASLMQTGRFNRSLVEVMLMPRLWWLVVQHATWRMAHGSAVLWLNNGQGGGRPFVNSSRIELSLFSIPGPAGRAQ